MQVQPGSGMESAVKLTLWSLAAGIIVQLSNSVVAKYVSTARADWATSGSWKGPIPGPRP